MLCIFDDRMEKTKIMGQEVWMEVKVSQLPGILERGSVKTNRFQGPLFNLARDFSRLHLTHHNVKEGGVI